MFLEVRIIWGSVVFVGVSFVARKKWPGRVLTYEEETLKGFFDEDEVDICQRLGYTPECRSEGPHYIQNSLPTNV